MRQQIDDNWWAYARIAVRRGRAVVTHLVIAPVDEPVPKLARKTQPVEEPVEKPTPWNGISHTVLRRVSFPDAVDAILEEDRFLRKHGDSVVELWPLRHQQRRMASSPIRKARDKNRDEQLAEVAELYLEALRRDPRNPYRELKTSIEKKQRRKLKKVQDARNEVRAAREVGWLTRSTKGVTGGEPTDRLLKRRRAIARKPREQRKKREAKGRSKR